MSCNRALGLIALALAVSPVAVAHISTSPDSISAITLPQREDPERATLVVGLNIAGSNSWDALGDAANEVILFDVATMMGVPAGTPLFITAIGWNVTIETVGTSWISEARIYIDEPAMTGGVFIAPGLGTDAPGIASFASGPIPLSSNLVLPNGMLRLELYESFDDVPNAVDAHWMSTIFLTVEVPSPGTAAILLAAPLSAIRRRR